MTRLSIRTLEIGNFKSIDSLQIQGPSPFSVFAGANGSGKSNFVDALDFVSTFVRHGIDAALQRYGGIKNIRSRKRAASKAGRFDFHIACEFVDQHGLVSVFDYSVRMHRLYKQPELEEFLSVNGDRVITREIGNGRARLQGKPEIQGFPSVYSALSLMPENEITQFLKQLSVYRIDPADAKTPELNDVDSTRLDGKGSNLASVLRRLEGDAEVSAEILDWMQMIVPGVARVQTRQQKSDNSTALLIKELEPRHVFLRISFRTARYTPSVCWWRCSELRKDWD